MSTPTKSTPQHEPTKPSRTLFSLMPEPQQSLQLDMVDVIVIALSTAALVLLVAAFIDTLV